MKIVFLGTPDFAVPSLDILIKNKYDVVAVVTAPPKKSGRGLQIKPTAVGQYAADHGIPVLQPEKLSDPLFREELQKLNAGLFIVVAFRMLPEAIWKMPSLGTFNLHGSLLPQYRGAAPINRAVMNGETETGVTTFFLRQQIDTGNIIFRETIAIGNNETAGELHDRMMMTGAGLILKTVKAIESGNVPTISQDQLSRNDESLKTAPKIFTADCRLNWAQTAKQNHNHVRGLSPFPGAFTILSDSGNAQQVLKIYRTTLTDRPAVNAPGTISISENKLFISCSDFQLQIMELQVEGKKRIAAEAFLPGFRLEKGWKAVS